MDSETDSVSTVSTLLTESEMEEHRGVVVWTPDSSPSTERGRREREAERLEEGKSLELARVKTFGEREKEADGSVMEGWKMVDGPVVMRQGPGRNSVGVAF